MRLARLNQMAAVFALLSSLMWGTSDFIGGVISKRVASVVVVGATQCVGLITVATLALATGAWRSPTGYLPWAVLASLSGASGLVIFYRALATGTMGVVAPISAMAGLVPVTAGLLAGERFTAATAFGAALIAVGVVLASAPELRAEAGWRPLAMASVAALLFGISLLAIARGSEYSAIMTMTAMRVVSVTLLGLAVAVLVIRGTVRTSIPRNMLPLIVLVGVFDVMANVAFGASANNGPLVISAVLGSLYPVVTAILAAVILHERLRGVQYLGVAAALIGLSFVTLA